MCVCSLTYPARNAHSPYNFICGLSGFIIFFHLYHERHDFRLKLWKANVCFDFLNNFYLKHFSLYLYCCTVHLKTHRVLQTNEWSKYVLYISLKFITLNLLKCSYMFRSLVYPHETRIVPWQGYMLKLWICHYIYQWCGSISCFVYVLFPVQGGM